MTQQKIRNDITGQKFGRLIAIRPTDRKSCRHIVWEFACDCGGPVLVYKTAGNMRRAAITECVDCLKKTRAAKGGAVVQGRNKEHNAWRGILCRCYDPKVPEYKYYGGKGVKMCDEWLNSFDAFCEYVGPPPSKKHSIDRIDSNKDYAPGNVRWATPIEQSNNRCKVKKYSYEGDEISLPEICRRAGADYNLVRRRVTQHGWTVAEALASTAERSKFEGDKFLGEKGERVGHRHYTYKGERVTLRELATRHEVSMVMLQQRVRNGWHIEAALTYRNLSNV